MNGGSYRRLFRGARRALAAVALALALGAGPGAAQTAAPAGTDEVPAQIRGLIDLLADPVVRAWLERQRQVGPPPKAEPPGAPVTPGGYIAERLEAMRAHLASLPDAFAKLPRELGDASRILYLEFEEQGLAGLLVLFAAFVGLGFGTELVFRWATRGTVKWIVGLPVETGGERLRAVLIRFAYGTGLVATFTVGSVGAFLVFDWSLLLKEIVLGYLIAFLALRMALVVGRLLLAPGGARFRVVPMDTEAAWFWHRRLWLAVAWFAFGWVSVALLATFGVAPEVRRLVAYLLGLGLLAIGLEMAWRRPVAARPGAAGPRSAGLRAGAWLVSAYFVLLYGLWVASATPALWLAVVAVFLPASMRAVQRSVNHILRPPVAPGAPAAAAEVPGVAAVCLERGLRAALIIGAAAGLGHAWGLDLGGLAEHDTAVTRLARGALIAVGILLVADFIWHALKALIDRKLIEAQDPGQPDSDEAHRRARLRTLLPILRNMVFVVLSAMAALMALSSLGVEIGPLVAGAGVVGVAVGFGAQTLVRDVLSGVFFLMDDAFRIGEYIQAGNFKGTVESFSLRSVKLRHHRGPLYTVPFGALGAVQNMSRDWVIDKLQIGVTYDSDLDKAKKLIKQVGKELAEDKEFAPNIIETLKMQGVEQFGDFAVQIRMKMKTKPGEQFTIRRRAYALIKKAFDANDIKFAFPTVQVAGGAGEAATAAARQAIERAQPPQAS